jgi:2-oxo-4-hydroxy-4-carboxy-5-ureidoimidazoline decarboxylase
MSDVAAINSWSEPEARAAFLRCCGATRWAARMAARRPFAGEAELFAAAGQVWRSLTRADWLEAFAAHPKIGDLEALRRKFAATASWSAGEQAGVAGASETTLQALAEGNRRYEARFGHIFIVCATGKTAAEMLALLDQRLGNEPEEELRIAAGEQEKITQLRLRKLCT